MVRKTALVTAMLGAFASQAFAMGLGDIRLNTVLNQPLNADIELLSPTAGELAELRVVLASSEAYSRAGVERAFFHTKLRFEVVKRPDGTAVVRVTSREPVREPYLNFLLEATWGSGQVLREYTVLVDPPALMPAPRPVTQAPAVATPALAPRATAAPAPTAAPVPSGRVGDEYRTSRSDTLWKIAAEVRPDSGVSMEQTMLGLLEANPNAFFDQNINKLKAGYVLRVPSREELTARSQGDASAEVRRQNQLWRDGRTAEAPAVEAPSASPAQESAVAPPAAGAEQPEAQLKLVVPEAGETGSAAGTGGAEVEELRKELTLAVEAVEAQRQQNQDLNTRLQDLEAQISQLHRLIELKDSEMAQLSGSAAPAAEAPAAAPAPAGDGTATPAETAAETAPQAPEATTEQVPAAPEAAESSAAMPDTEETESVAAPEPAPVPEAPAQAEAEKPPVPEESGLLATLMANPLFKWVAAGIGLLIALLVWMGARRRRADAGDFQESILAERRPAAAASAAPVAAAATVAASAAAADVVETPAAAPAKSGAQSDSSLFTDFAVSDMGAIHNDAEADPVAEADVYLAYGRYQQAEELIRGALDQSPQRNDLRLKLLEVLFAARNANGFDTEAEALLASLGGQDDALWQRVREMGQEISPANPLYSGAAAAARGPAAEESLDFTPSYEAPGAAQGEAESKAGTDDNSLDFDMGELASFTPKSETVAPDLPVEEDLGFDLTGGAESDDAGEGVLASADEVATKLDLARAYIEMGDPDGARSILGEVMQEGNAAHKSEAQALLKQIT
jgi:pilus assembly protein FimV